MTAVFDGGKMLFSRPARNGSARFEPGVAQRYIRRESSARRPCLERAKRNRRWL